MTASFVFDSVKLHFSYLGSALTTRQASALNTRKSLACLAINLKK